MQTNVTRSRLVALDVIRFWPVVQRGVRKAVITFSADEKENHPRLFSF